MEVFFLVMLGIGIVVAACYEPWRWTQEQIKKAGGREFFHWKP